MYDENLYIPDDTYGSDPYYTLGSVDIYNPSEDDMLTMLESTM